MSIAEPIVRTVEITEVQRELSPLAREVARNALRVIVEESGSPVAALVSLDDLQHLEDIRREREARFAVIDRMRAAFADVSTEEIEREVAMAVAEVRGETAANSKVSALARS